MIKKWMITHNVPLKELNMFDKDLFHGYLHADIPSSAM